MREIDTLAGRCLMIGIEGTTAADAAALLDRVRPGAVILFDRNLADAAQLRALTDGLRAHAHAGGWPPPLIAIDQEGGIVQRLVEPAATEWPSLMCLGAADDEALTRAYHAAIGRELHALGIDWDLAPCVDVNNNQDNPVILTRSFGADPALVARHGVAAHRGFVAAGVLDCAKHFPGHGDTTVDSHLALPVIRHNRSRLDAVELAPFRAAIAAGIDSVMIAHMLLPALDEELPASLSPRVIGGLLREEMGYDGVVVTDAIGMKALGDRWPPGEAAAHALRAGADLVIAETSALAVAAHDGILAAVRAGTLPEARLREAVVRVARLAAGTAAAAERPFVNGDRHAPQSLSRDIAAAGATWIRGGPIGSEKPGLLIVPGELPRYSSTRAEELTTHLAERVAELRPGSVTLRVPLNPDDATVVRAAGLAVDADWVAVATLDAHRHAGCDRLVESLRRHEARLWAVALGHPGDATRWPWVQNALALYGWRKPCLAVLPEVLFGQRPATGRSPMP